MSEQFEQKPDDSRLTDLIRDMWRCIQVSPMSPPALKESIRERMTEYGIDTSPTNPCSHVGNECRYETREVLRDE